MCSHYIYVEIFHFTIYRELLYRSYNGNLSMNYNEPSIIVSLIAGGIAGTTVDAALFPLDTLKTRLQSKNGFWKSGGFHKIYKGFAPAMIASAPSAALFFCSYNLTKSILKQYSDESYHVLVHLGAASIAEVVCCLVKVPAEICKQRQQAGLTYLTLKNQCKELYVKEGLRGFYCGFTSTALREIPFSAVQFPVWEFFKSKLQEFKHKDLSPLEVALCGALSGAVAAGATTPLDVAKTRIMLSDEKLRLPQHTKELKWSKMLYNIYVGEGIFGLFSGFVPRILHITIGGAIFFGSYEISKNFLMDYLRL